MWEFKRIKYKTFNKNSYFQENCMFSSTGLPRLLHFLHFKRICEEFKIQTLTGFLKRTNAVTISSAWSNVTGPPMTDINNLKHS